MSNTLITRCRGGTSRRQVQVGVGVEQRGRREESRQGAAYVLLSSDRRGGGWLRRAGRRRRRGQEVVDADKDERA